jgi:ABC-type amino acid transport substrate-binding protein
MSFERTLVTRPYYRSTYVFVVRRDSKVRVSSFDDAVLRRVRVGVQLVGDDGANAPPAHALARRGMVDNVVGYTVYGDYAQPNPPARIIDAVARGEVDVAIVWGPLAGYFTKRNAIPLALAPLPDSDSVTGFPFAFDIAMGVRKGDAALRDSLDRVLERRCTEVERVLDTYGVPRASTEPCAAAAPAERPADRVS